MNSLNEMISSIETIMSERYRDPSSFESFAKELMQVGITRLSFDTLKNELGFYTKNKFIHSLLRSDLLKAQEQAAWHLGDALHSKKLEEAIKKLDAGDMNAVEFHQEIAAAGVVYCNVYLTHRKIYYMGQDGQYYLESY